MILELLDIEGHEARYTREERVRFLRTTSKITDYGWGDGIAFAQHEVSPGRFKARKLIGSKLRSFVSLGRRYHRGDELTFSIERLVKNGFIGPDQWWLEAEIYHHTHQISMEVRFPAERPVSNAQLETLIYKAEPRRLPSGLKGEQSVLIEATDPAVGERFRLSWNW